MSTPERTRLQFKLLIAAGLIGLIPSALLGLWAMWASATPTWQTHADGITQQYYAAIAGIAVSLVVVLVGTLGLAKSKAA